MSFRNLPPTLRAEYGRKGAISSHAQHDSAELTKKARETFLARFTTEDEKHTYFAAIAARSAEVRRLKKTEYPNPSEHKAKTRMSVWMDGSIVTVITALGELNNLHPSDMAELLIAEALDARTKLDNSET